MDQSGVAGAAVSPSRLLLPSERVGGGSASGDDGE